MRNYSLRRQTVRRAAGDHWPVGQKDLDRGVTTPTTHRWYPVAAGSRALNENQRPGPAREKEFASNG